jgi:hypothetical protein
VKVTVLTDAAPRRVQPLLYRLAATAGSLQQEKSLLLLFIAFASPDFMNHPSWDYPLYKQSSTENVNVFS